MQSPKAHFFDFFFRSISFGYQSFASHIINIPSLWFYISCLFCPLFKSGFSLWVLGTQLLRFFVYSLNYVSDGVKVEPIMIFRFFFLTFLVLVSGLRGVLWTMLNTLITPGYLQLTYLSKAWTSSLMPKWLTWVMQAPYLAHVHLFDVWEN